MRGTRKLLPALAMLLVAFVVMTTASYAWFTMSRNVDVTGLDFTAIAPTNLLISTEFDTGYSSAVDLSEFFGNGARMYPASSLTGDTFFAPEFIEVGKGGKADRSTVFNNVTGQSIAHNGKGYYAEFTLYFRTNGADDVEVIFDSEFTKVAGDNVGKATRISVVGVKTYTPKVTVVAESDAENPAVTTIEFETTDEEVPDERVFKFENEYLDPSIVGPIVTYDAEETDVDYYLGASDAEYIAKDDVAIFTVPVGKTVAVTLRVWLEGQSKSCAIDDGQPFDPKAFQLTIVFKDKLYTNP